LSSGLIPNINSFIQQVHAANPAWSPEQVKSVAQERLKADVQMLQSSAAVPAAGNSPVNMNLDISVGMNSNAAGMSPTQFQAHLQRQVRAQQQVARTSSGGSGSSE